MNRRLLPTVLLAVTASVFTACGGTDDRLPSDSEGFLVPSTETFTIFGSVLEDKDVSTISRGAAHVGLLASDEGAVIQLLAFSEDGRSATIQANVPLAQPTDLEIDFEASAFLDGWFYVTGSHGVAKKKGDYQESRSRIFRFRVREDGRTIDDLQASSLAPLLIAHPTLASHHRQPLQQRGLNIEGLAARDGALYVGFRGPNADGDAFVLKVSPAQVFSNNPSGSELLRVPLAPGLGIRAMDTVGDGFLLVAGNAGAEPSKAQPLVTDYVEGRPSALYYWNPASDEAVRLGLLPKRGKGKEEAILTLSHPGEGTVRALILYDSIEGGGATVFTVDLPN